MKRIVLHIQKRKRIYLEIALAIIVIVGFGLFYPAWPGAKIKK